MGVHIIFINDCELNGCSLSKYDVSVNKVVCYGVKREACKRMDLEFSRDIPSVSNNGVYGDEKVGGDLFVAHSLHETDNNLFLSLGESFCGVNGVYYLRYLRGGIVGLHPFL